MSGRAPHRPVRFPGTPDADRFDDSWTDDLLTPREKAFGCLAGVAYIVVVVAAVALMAAAAIYLWNRR